MTMKKLLLILLTTLLPMLASAYDIEVKNAAGVTIYYNYIYINNNTEVEVTYGDDYNGYTGNVAIPNSVTYEGVTLMVREIGGHAFSDCPELTSVNIPNSVTYIGDYAFEDCSGLTSITLGNGVTGFGIGAFIGCTGLTSIVIPNSVIGIGDAAFCGCTGLTTITIPNSVTGIGAGAFTGCTGLTSITIPQSVTYINGQAFSDCSSLTSVNVESGNPKYDSRGNCNAIIETASNTLIAGCINTTIPNSVTSIGDFAFYECTGLTSLTIPNSIKSIGEHAFTDSRDLISLTIPQSVTSIGDYAFWGCSGLTSINVESGNPIYDSRENCNAIIETASNTLIKGCENAFIPDGVKSIGEGAFHDCYAIAPITIPNSVTSIGPAAFGNSALCSLIIPNSVTWIGDEAFHDCYGLTSIIISNSITSIGERVFQNCCGLSSVNIPNSVTSIGRQAFYGCSGLTSVIIPNSVMDIESFAFAYCTSLISVYSLIENPNDIDSYAFDTAVYDNCTLYVPVGTTSKYEECKGWNDFAFIEEGAPASISTSKMVNKTKTKSYSIDGKMLNKPQKGLNIIQYSDGTTQKVVSK